MKCCDIKAGMLRSPITIEQEIQVKDSVGGYTSTWVNLLSTYAYIKPLSGTERVQAMRLESNTTHRIYIRYNANVSTKDRLIYNGREMQIESVLNIEERNDWLEMRCIEGKVN